MVIDWERLFPWSVDGWTSKRLGLDEKEVDAVVQCAREVSVELVPVLSLFDTASPLLADRSHRHLRRPGSLVLDLDAAGSAKFSTVPPTEKGRPPSVPARPSRARR